jgi:hypothetical protein
MLAAAAGSLGVYPIKSPTVTSTLRAFGVMVARTTPVVPIAPGEVIPIAPSRCGTSNSHPTQMSV